jgi:CHASE2 domain-containing sensor protein
MLGQRKLVILKVGEGSFDRGFPVSLQIGIENARSSLEITGRLPSLPEIIDDYQNWQYSYLHLGFSIRLGVNKVRAANVSLSEECENYAAILQSRFNRWLRSESFRSIREKWLEKLSSEEEIRFIIQTENKELQKLPWHLWEVLQRYPKAELAFSLPVYEEVKREPVKPNKAVKILAIFGDSTGIDLDTDRQILEQLPDAEVCFLVEPERQELSEKLWQDWDIFFFAGHSKTQNNCGRMFINKAESLTIEELKYILRKTIANGLQLAIFNSCDGLGLAWECADLQIPQIILFKEPVPDKIAQTFLNYFLTAFASNKPLYLSIRQARERLQGLENRYPCATWLPTIYQNPAETPLNWQDFLVKKDNSQNNKRSQYKLKLIRSIATSVLFTVAIVGIRYFGFLQSWELSAFDFFTRQQPQESTDSRITIVTIDEKDIQQQNRGTSSLSDDSLDRLLSIIEPYQPTAVGLDIYRDFPVSPQYSKLAKRLQSQKNFIAICKVSDSESDITGVTPPPEVPHERIGFSDFIEDEDSIVRRQLLFMNPDPTSNCAANYSFALQLAFRYLAARDVLPSYTPEGNLKLGETVFTRLENRWGGYQNIDARGGQILLKYRSNSQPFSQISLERVFNGELKVEAVKNRIILIGVTARSGNDYWLTPQGKIPTQRQAGVFIQAQMASQIISTVLDKRPFHWVWQLPIEIIWIGGWCFLGGIASDRLHNLLLRQKKISQFATERQVFYSTICIGTIVTVGGLYFICYFVFVQGGWIPFIPAMLGSVGNLIINY